MSKRRWMAAVIKDAKKTADTTAPLLPFARQRRLAKRGQLDPKTGQSTARA